MSVPEIFLRGGIPCRSIEDWKKFSTPYTRWRWVVCFPRLWSLDIRKNEVSSPMLHLLFGSNASCNEEEEDGGISSWHLLLLHPNHHCVNALKDGLHTIMKPYMKEAPKGLFPQRMDVVAILKGNTHEKINLFTEDMWEGSCSHIQDCLCECAGRKVEVMISSIVDGQLKLGSGNGFRAAKEFASLAWSAMDWGQRKHALVELRDASLPGVPPTTSLIELLFRVSPLLYRGMFSGRGGRDSGKPGKEPLLNGAADSDSLSESSSPALMECKMSLSKGKMQKLRENKAAAARILKEKVGECTTFSFPFAVRGSAASKLFHVLLWQKPVVKKIAVQDTEDLDPGPLSPQPFAAELHIYADRGEPLYLQQYIRDVASTLDFCFDDILHEAGEILVQLSPVEGVPFDILDEFIVSVEEKMNLPRAQRSTEESVANTTNSMEVAAGTLSSASPHLFSSKPFLSDSCSGFVFPRVVRRAPTGNTAKLNPMTRTRTEVKCFPPTSDDVEIAMAALETLSQHIYAPVSEGIDQDEGKQRKDNWPQHVADGAFFSHTPRKYMIDSDRLPEVYFSPIPSSLCTSALDVVVAGNPGSSPSCEWCQRRLEKLLQCSGCKMVFYCSKRHQLMDWKERHHRLECKWWKRGWEWMRSDVGPFTAERVSTEPWRTDSLAVSYARSVFSFLQTVAKEWNQEASNEGMTGGECSGKEAKEYFLLYILLRDLSLTASSDGSSSESRLPLAKEFLEALEENFAQRYSCSTGAIPNVRVPTNEGPTATMTPSLQGTARNSSSQIRCVLVCSTFSDSERNTVWTVQGEDGKALLRPPTGVLGDIWREGEATESELPTGHRGVQEWDSSRPLFLCRVTNSSMHELLPSRSTIASTRRTPDAVISFGPCNGAGLSYLNSSVEVAANQLAGLVPTRWIESSYVGALRTQRAIYQRVMNSIQSSSRVQDFMRDTWNSNESFPVKTNYSGVLCGLHYKRKTDAASCSASEAEETTTPVPIFPNAYEFDIPALSDM